MRNSLFVDLNKIHSSKGNIRSLETIPEIVDLDIRRCTICGKKESRTNSLPAEGLAVLPQEFEIIHFVYYTTERGAHSFMLSDELKPIYHNSKGFPITYNGRDSYPDHAFLLLDKPIKHARFWAVRDFNADKLKTIGTVYGGNSGHWHIVTDIELSVIEIYDREMVHPRCKLENALENMIIHQDVIENLDEESFPTVVRPNRFSNLTANGLSTVWSKMGELYALKLDETLSKLTPEQFKELLGKWNNCNPGLHICDIAIKFHSEKSLLENLKDFDTDVLSKMYEFVRKEIIQ